MSKSLARCRVSLLAMTNQLVFNPAHAPDPSTRLPAHTSWFLSPRPHADHKPRCHSMQFLMAILRISSIYLCYTSSVQPQPPVLRPEIPTLELNFSLWFFAHHPASTPSWYKKNVFYRTALSASLVSRPSSFQSLIQSLVQQQQLPCCCCCCRSSR